MNMEGGDAAAATPTSIRRCAPFTPEERAKVQEQMQATYDTFVEKAAAGRNTTPERIDAIAQGRVWTGEAGQGDRPRRRARRARARARGCQAAREARRPTAKSSSWCFPGRKSIYDIVKNPFGGVRAAPARSARCSASAIRGRCRRSPRRCGSSAAASRWRSCRMCSCDKRIPGNAGLGPDRSAPRSARNRDWLTSGQAIPTRPAAR